MTGEDNILNADKMRRGALPFNTVTSCLQERLLPRSCYSTVLTRLRLSHRPCTTTVPVAGTNGDYYDIRAPLVKLEIVWSSEQSSTAGWLPRKLIHSEAHMQQARSTNK
jgi:hypothetical protein